MIRSKIIGVRLMHVFLLSLPVTASENAFARCNYCEDEGSLVSIERIIECQRVSDFLIAVAYLSIPIELLYFISCSNVPFKWVLFQFIAFIVLCGLTHLLNGWTYGPHPFQLILALTVFKILTALVSCATAITLFSLIPLLLKVKVREFMLKKKTWDLGREVGLIMKQREAGLHVRMLTQVIRNSLDRSTIIDTTLVELSKILMLQNCAIWMPNEAKMDMNLTHSLTSVNPNSSIPTSNPDIIAIEESNEVRILHPDSLLASVSRGETGVSGPVAAIRMPKLRVCNFKAGTPDMVQQCYAILVLVLPSEHDRKWTEQELEIVKVVADQVAVAISHVAMLEESQMMREKLEWQNRALQKAKRSAMMASQARVACQKVMSDGMKKPMHSILGLIALMQDKETSKHQRTILDSMMKTSSVLATLINDVVEIPSKDSGRFPLQLKPFNLQNLVRELCCTASCLCAFAGVKLAVDVDRTIPENVIGDENRLTQVVLHMMATLINGNATDDPVSLRISSDGNRGSSSASSRVRIELTRSASDGRRVSGDPAEDPLRHSVCRKLAQMMQGNVWVSTNQIGMEVRFHVQQPAASSIREYCESEHPHSNSLFRGVQVLLADADNVNRVVTRKFLEKLGLSVTAVATGFECLSFVSAMSAPYRVVMLDLQMAELDGYEVATRIRKYRSHGWPIIVALTASFDEDVWDRCQQIGINGVIKKPVMMQGIAKELRRLLMQGEL